MHTSAFSKPYLMQIVKSCKQQWLTTLTDFYSRYNESMVNRTNVFKHYSFVISFSLTKVFYYWSEYIHTDKIIINNQALIAEVKACVKAMNEGLLSGLPKSS